MGIILPYDCTDEESFTLLEGCIKWVKHAAYPGTSMLLLANSCDSPGTKELVRKEKKFAVEYGLKFGGIKANNEYDMKKMLYTFIKDIIKRSPLKSKRLSNVKGSNDKS
jgi:hypothetical protein